MPLSGFIFFTTVLFVLRQAVGATTVLNLGTQYTHAHVLGEYFAVAVVSTSVFTYMSVIHPTKPLRSALAVGVSSYALGILATALIAGTYPWVTPLLVVDGISLLLAIFAGVSLAKIFRPRT
jgi:hypothetical protein